MVIRGNVEKAVNDYIKMHPEIINAMKYDILNMSKLSRRISRELNYNEISVRSSLNKLLNQKKNQDYTSKIDILLKNSKITLQDKITVVTTNSKIDGINFISATYLTDSIVYIIDETKNENLKFKPSVSLERDVSAIHIFSSMEIVNTPGFVMKINEKLFAFDINVLQLISCSNETIIIVRRDDAIKAYEALAGK
ncbi:ACT domain-containing protein [Picrophilus oshimae]|uniref:Aspartate kinase n=1 Tax=Picrophilus torridus (strain ATCC 700027 / DSM 9790 / JCM 10055 / NBRC 100828 / KAW 2/3) TaxID=1122961 RepID=Q6L1N8_PICTO|nr:ACT domain-containing protein [Picrophilus oshimae]AAT43114.1 hypothetical protein PTO0529 [Picrophilus oshimae DSM 9789]SMD30578.1 hypothetical protein SAMN02745355_0467 [Picrophilus oshimae DSM 9789]